MPDEGEIVRVPVAQPLQHDIDDGPSRESDSLSSEEPPAKKARVEDADYASAGHGRPWTPEEDEILWKLRGEDVGWTSISQHFERRSGDACRTRYNRLVMLTGRVSGKRGSHSTTASPAPINTSAVRSTADRHSTGTSNVYSNGFTAVSRNSDARSSGTPKKDDYVRLMVDSNMCKARMQSLDASLEADRVSIRELESRMARTTKQKAEEKKRYEKIVAKADTILQSLTAEAQHERSNGI